MNLAVVWLVMESMVVKGLLRSVIAGSGGLGVVG